MSAKALAAEVGVSHSALSEWLREARALGGMTRPPPPLDEPSPPDSVPTTTPAGRAGARSPQEQLRLLADADSLTGEALGSLLRREGVLAAELDAWRGAVLEALRGRAPGPAPHPADRKRIQGLERELARKERALAEAAALLLLQKKLSGAAPFLLDQKLPLRHDPAWAGRSGRRLFGDSTP